MFNTKRGSTSASLILVTTFLMLSMSSFAFAQTGEEVGRDIGEGVNEVTSGLGEVFNTIFPGGSLDQGSQISKILFAILLALLIFNIVSTTFLKGSSKWITWTVTLAVTGLAFIGMPDGFLESIRSSYGALGIAILGVVPFAIIFWFTVKTESVVLSRITWIFYILFYAATFIGAMIYGPRPFWGPENFFRLIGLIAGSVVLWTIPSIRKFAFKGEVEGLYEKAETKLAKRKLTRDIQEKEADDLAGN